MTELKKIRLLYFIRFFGDALFYPFLSLFLVSKAIPGDKIGLILSVIPIVSIVMNLLFNYLSKDANMNRNIIKILALIEAFVIFTFTKVEGFHIYLVLTIIIATAVSPYYSLLDGFSATYANKKNVEYASIRVFGSSGFIIALLAAGIIVHQTNNFNVIFYLSSIFFISSTFMVFFIKPLELTENKSEVPKRDYKSLFTNKEFFKYTIFYILVMGTVYIGDQFYSIYLTQRGIKPYLISFIISITLIFEAIFLQFMTRKGYSLKSKHVFIVAAVLVVIRFFAYGLYLPLGITIALISFRGISWGLVLATHFKFIIKLVKIENVTIAILTLAMINSLYSGIGVYFGGILYVKYGFAKFYIGISIIALAGLLFLTFFTPKTKEELALKNDK